MRLLRNIQTALNDALIKLFKAIYWHFKIITGPYWVKKDKMFMQKAQAAFMQADQSNAIWKENNWFSTQRRSGDAYMQVKWVYSFRRVHIAVYFVTLVQLPPRGCHPPCKKFPLRKHAYSNI